MARSVDPALRPQLLALAVEHCLARGVSNLSLRPLAQALGVSPRMLLYHFESKDRLIAAIVDEAQRRQRALLTAWLERRPGYDFRSQVIGAWLFLRAPRHERYLRFAFELHALGLRDRRRFGPVAARMSADSIDIFRRVLEDGGVPASDAKHAAELLAAVARGLLLEALATGDRASADRAFRAFVASLEFPAPRAAARPSA
jgi:AcrR family transcriptional regulator